MNSDQDKRQHDAEREIVFGWCRRLGLPLWSPPRAPEAIDTLGREVERLRELLRRIALGEPWPDVAGEVYDAIGEPRESDETEAKENQ